MKIFVHKNKKIKINARKVSLLGKLVGLMFKSRNTENLLFEFEKESEMSIHSCFVFFPFLAVWLDEKNRVIEKRVVHPFKLCVKPKKSFRKLVELPLNKSNLKAIDFLVGKGKI